MMYNYLLCIVMDINYLLFDYYCYYCYYCLALPKIPIPIYKYKPEYEK